MEKKRGNRFRDRTGEIFTTKQGYKVQLIEYTKVQNKLIEHQIG